MTATPNPVVVAMEVDVGPGLFFLQGEIFITRGMIAIHKASLHVLQPSDAQAALDSSIALYFAAACSQLIVRKSRGFLALPSITFITGQQTNKHLGVFLGYDMQAASHQQFTSIGHAISAKIRHWAARGLSFLGRVHVAMQVLAASL